MPNHGTEHITRIGRLGDDTTYIETRWGKTGEATIEVTEYHRSGDRMHRSADIHVSELHIYPEVEVFDAGTDDEWVTINLWDGLNRITLYLSRPQLDAIVQTAVHHPVRGEDA